MKWASTISEARDTDRAAGELVEGAREALGDARADLGVIFASPHHDDGLGALAARLTEAFPAALLLGCSGGGVIGGGRELEQRPALSLTVASLPGVQLGAVHLDVLSWPGEPEEVGAWRTALGGGAPGGGALGAGEDATFLVLPDPFTCDAQALVAALDRAFPAAAKIGGLVSGGDRPGRHSLLLGGARHRDGAVVAWLRGDVAVDTLVAQGCRPVGPPMVVTRCESNRAYELNQQPALQVLESVYEGADASTQRLMRRALFVGVEMSADQVEYRERDILVRNVIGSDPEEGCLAVATELRPWQVLRFLVRDAASARDDLDGLLREYASARGADAPAAGAARGALLFSCLGRGEGLFGVPDHDSGLLRRHLGALPLGGFFCNGEIGPVGARTFLHGYTSAFGLFRPREGSAR